MNEAAIRKALKLEDEWERAEKEGLLEEVEQAARRFIEFGQQLSPEEQLELERRLRVESEDLFAEAVALKAETARRFPEETRQEELRQAMDRPPSSSLQQ